MKTLLLFTILLFSNVSINAQVDNFSLSEKNIFNALDFQNKNIAANFKINNIQKGHLFFNSYNKISQLNDSYSLENKIFIYSKSYLIFENSFRGAKIDSFNPFGSSNINSSLIMGSIDTLLNFIIK